jgi:hypothetical protein
VREHLGESWSGKTIRLPSGALHAKAELKNYSFRYSLAGSQIEGPYRRSVRKLDVYVRKDPDRYNTHENLAAFKP